MTAIPKGTLGLVPPQRNIRPHRRLWWLRDARVVVGIVLVAGITCSAIFAPYVSIRQPMQIDLGRALQTPALTHPFGTDSLGRDLLSRVLFAGRTSLVVGLVSVATSLVLGIPLGLIAGYAGGRVDLLAMRFVDVLQAFPGLLLAIAVIAILGPGILNMMLAIGISASPLFARLLRASVLEVKSEEFVDAARAIGGTDLRIMGRHIFPNALGPLIAQSTLRLGSAILTSASLSFLGLGVQPPQPEWGAMVSEARQYFVSDPYLIAFPGLAILLSVLGFNLLGEALSDRIDPRLTRAR
jgi:peptide/nickel transport system permease protein